MLKRFVIAISILLFCCFSVNSDLILTSELGSWLEIHSIDSNLYLGEYAGDNSESGQAVVNLGIGNQALLDLTIGDYNCVVGHCAGENLSTGVKNVLLGNFTGRNINSSYNVALGHQALSGISMEMTGDNNIAIGVLALYRNETGSYNIAVGRESLGNTTGGHFNIGIGSLSLRDVSTARQNTVIGYNSDIYNETGWNNTCLGAYAGQGVLDNSHQDNTFIGASSGYNVTTGSNNIFVGCYAGRSITTGMNNLIIGYNQDLPTPITSNHLNIGGIIKGDMNTNELQIPAETIFISPPAQVISDVGNTILPNATVVILDPDSDYALTSIPTIPDGSVNQLLYIRCANGETNSVTLKDQTVLLGTNLEMQSGTRILTGKKVLCLMFDGVDWIEISYANN